jgi:hypothetical protein
MVVELLAHKIRKSNNIKGITIGNTEIKLVQMADDTTVFVEDPNSLENILKILNKFEQYAGLKLNKLKTEAMWVGKDKNNTDTPLGIKWVNRVHSLGIFFSYDTDYVVQKNFTDKAKDFKRILDMWIQRDLSLIGKITILKSLAFSKIIYQCGVLTIPPNFVEQINDLAYQFIWNNKPEKVKRKTVIAEYEKGGLKMLDITNFLKAQKAMWVKRLMSTEEGSWKALPMLFLKDLLGKDTFKCNTTCKTKPTNFPGFYWQILQSWFELKTLTNKHKSALDIRRETLWLNKLITINKDELLWTQWHIKGINQIHDIINQDGSFLTHQQLEEKYNIKCNFLKYNTLKDAIPSTWRKMLKNKRIPENAVSLNEQIHINIGKTEKALCNLTNKDVYWVFINEIKVKAITLDKLQNKYNLDDKQCEEIFTISKSVRNTKLRTFQYKILLNLIPCNLYLSRIERSDTNKCNMCHKLDDVTHYFYECTQNKQFWKSFEIWWKNTTETNIKLSERDIMIGKLGNQKSLETLNASLLIAKWYIYKCKLAEEKLFFYKFLCDMKFYLIIEKTINIEQGKLDSYNKIWQNIEDILT